MCIPLRPILNKGSLCPKPLVGWRRAPAKLRAPLAVSGWLFTLWIIVTVAFGLQRFKPVLPPSTIRIFDSSNSMAAKKKAPATGVLPSEHGGRASHAPESQYMLEVFFLKLSSDISSKWLMAFMF